MYPKAEILTRLTTWKAPLITLITLFPRSPLEVLTQVLTILHLIGDPIGTIEGLLFTLERFQRQVISWQDRVEAHDNARDTHQASSVDQSLRQQWSRSLAIIVELYRELGETLGSRAEQALVYFTRQRMISLHHRYERQSFFRECSTFAGALSADRATRLVPVLVTQAVFGGILLTDILRLRSADQSWLSGITYVPIEMHSIAFSSLFFWLLPAISIAAVIGTSQTENAIPTILMLFRRDLRRVKRSGISAMLPGLDSNDFGPDQRWCHGMYSWQSLLTLGKRVTKVRENQEFEVQYLQRRLSLSAWQHLRRFALPAWPVIYLTLPTLTVAAAIATATLISYYVPPVGWRTRTWGQTYYLFGWLGSYLLSDAISWLPSQRAKFWFMMFKDFVVTALALGMIIIVQLGYHNKAESYIGDERTGLVLPQQPNAYDKVQECLQPGGAYFTILLLGLSFQGIIVPALVYTRYESAMLTLLRKDKKTRRPRILYRSQSWP